MQQADNAEKVNGKYMYKHLHVKFLHIHEYNHFEEIAEINAYIFTITGINLGFGGNCPFSRNWEIQPGSGNHLSQCRASPAWGPIEFQYFYDHLTCLKCLSSKVKPYFSYTETFYLH